MNNNIVEIEAFIRQDEWHRYRENVWKMWLQVTLCGHSLNDFFANNNLYKIIVYGYGDIGKTLYREIDKSELVNVVAVVDANASKKIDAELDIISPRDVIPICDVMVVTIPDINSVRNEFEGKGYNIIGIDEILMGYYG